MNFKSIFSISEPEFLVEVIKKNLKHDVSKDCQRSDNYAEA